MDVPVLNCPEIIVSSWGGGGGAGGDPRRRRCDGHVVAGGSVGTWKHLAHALPHLYARRHTKAGRSPTLTPHLTALCA